MRFALLCNVMLGSPSHSAKKSYVGSGSGLGLGKYGLPYGEYESQREVRTKVSIVMYVMIVMLSQ